MAEEDPKEEGGLSKFGKTLASVGFTMAGLQTALNRNSEGEAEVTTNVQRLVSAIKQVTGFTKEQATGYRAVEKQGALFRTSFEQHREASIELRDELKMGVSVYDAFTMGLTATRAGLDKNNLAIQNLMRVASITGEQFGAMILPLKGLTSGNLRQNKLVHKLINATNSSANAFGRSTTELISAMKVLSQQFLDLMNVGFISDEVLQEFTFLRGIADLEVNAKRQNKFFEKILTDPTQAAVLGVMDLANKITRGENVRLNMIKLQLKSGKKREELLGKNVQQGVVMTHIAGRLNKGWSIVEAEVTRNNFLTDVGNKLGKTAGQVAAMSAENIEKQLSQLGMEQSISNTQWSQTLDVFKREVAAPMMSALSEVGAQMRKMWGGTFGDKWQKFIFGIGKIFAGLVTAFAEIADFLTLGFAIGTELKKISSQSMNFYRNLEQAEENLLAEQKKTAENTKKPPPAIDSLWGDVRNQMKLEVRQSKMIIKGIDQMIRHQMRQVEATKGAKVQIDMANPTWTKTSLKGGR